MSLPKVNSQYSSMCIWWTWCGVYGSRDMPRHPEYSRWQAASTNWHGKGPILAVGLAGLQAVVEAAEETIEQVAIRSS